MKTKEKATVSRQRLRLFGLIPITVSMLAETPSKGDYILLQKALYIVTVVLYNLDNNSVDISVDKCEDEAVAIK